MPILRIEHPVPDFEAWKKAFDDDPAHRERSGVRRYRVLRGVDDSRFVTVDLEFDSPAKAEAFRSTLRELWRKVDGTLMNGAAGSDARDGGEQGVLRVIAQPAVPRRGRGRRTGSLLRVLCEEGVGSEVRDVGAQ